MGAHQIAGMGGFTTSSVDLGMIGVTERSAAFDGMHQICAPRANTLAMILLFTWKRRVHVVDLVVESDILIKRIH